MVDRVKGVGEKNAVTFSQSGLTANGAPFAGAPAMAKPAKATKETRAAPATAPPTSKTTPAAMPTKATAATAATPATTVTPAMNGRGDTGADSGPRRRSLLRTEALFHDRVLAASPQPKKVSTSSRRAIVSRTPSAMSSRVYGASKSR